MCSLTAGQQTECDRISVCLFALWLESERDQSRGNKCPLWISFWGQFLPSCFCLWYVYLALSMFSRRTVFTSKFHGSGFPLVSTYQQRISYVEETDTSRYPNLYRPSTTCTIQVRYLKVVLQKWSLHIFKFGLYTRKYPLTGDLLTM